MSTRTFRALSRPPWAIIWWLVAIGSLIAGVILMALGGALVQERLTLDRVVLCLAAATVGTTILVRRPGHGVGRICLAAGVLAGVGILGAGLTLAGQRGYVADLVPTVGLLTAIVAPVAAYGLVGPVLLGAFPSGRFGSVGRWVAPIACIILVPLAILVIITSPTLDYGGNSTFNPLAIPYSPEWISTLGLAILIAAYVIGLLFASIGLIARYRTATNVERQQIRLVAANAIAIITIPITLVILLPLAGFEPDETAGSLMSTSLLLIAASMPLSVAVAILRYRLYDIDRVISNAIGYSLVTILLFAVFAVVNLVLVSQLSPLVDNQGVAVAASTLLVASMFNPLRTRVQRAVDRRFHRARYDAQRLVDDFSGRLRDVLDLSTLTRELEATSGMAVEPSSAHVWLREAGR